MAAVDLFDVLGPIAVGPSSSHTAGAARIGRVCRNLLGEPVLRADISLYGSFSDTYWGHGTDKALIGGLLGLRTDDPSIRDSYALAQRAGMVTRLFIKKDVRFHPNTVAIEAEGDTRRVSIRASSIGGGQIRLDELDGFALGVSCAFDTIILPHVDMPGIMAGITREMAEARINIATARLSRSGKGREAVAVIEVDTTPGEELLDRLKKLPHISSVLFIPKLI